MSVKCTRNLILTLIAALVAAFAAGGTAYGARPAPLPAPAARPDGSTESLGPLYPFASDRFGVGVNPRFGSVGDFDVSRLRAGWYIDWGTELAPPHPAGLDYMQLVWTSRDTYSPNAGTLVTIAQANPGSVWIVGNEPDCIWQGNSTPDQYARVYHEVYTTLKAADPTCRVTIGGVVQATPLRLQWLDAVLARYQALYGRPFPADLWNIHAHILPEKRGWWGCDIPPGIDAEAGMLWDVQDHDRRDLLAGQIVRFRQWMADRGQRDKELIISEYGILLPEVHGYDQARVQAYMFFTFDYFMTATDPDLGCPSDGNRLVQRWAWYSLNVRRPEGDNPWSYLFDPTSKEISPLGQAYEYYVTFLYTPYVDLLPAAIYVSPPAPLVPACDAPGCVAGSRDQRINVTLTAQVRNAGNTALDGVSVRFWAGDPAHPIGARHISSLPARSFAAVSVQWPRLGIGPHTVGVTVDPEGAISESDEGNNSLQHTFLVASHRDYLPFLPRDR